MASKRILERAETAMELAKDFLFVDEDDDDEGSVSELFDDDDNGSEDLAENDDDAQTDAGKNDDPDEAGKKSADQQKDPKTKKKTQGVGKKMKSLMGVIMQPLGSKMQWKLHFNLGVDASNEKGGGKSDAQSKPSSSKNQNINNAPTSDSAATAKSLEKENKFLAKLANKFLDEYLRLQKRIGELSVVEGQLSSLRNDCDRLKQELLDSQAAIQTATKSMKAQSEGHRLEVNRLESELKQSNMNLSKMQATKTEKEDELKRLKKEMEAISNQNSTLKAELHQKEEEYCREVSTVTEQLRKREKENDRMLQQIQDEMSQNSALKDENSKLHLKLAHLEEAKTAISSQLEASAAKVNELRRVMAVLESNPHNSTMVEARNAESFACPICGVQFPTLGNMQLHAEDCGAD